MGDSKELPKITSPDDIKKLYAGLASVRTISVRDMLTFVPDMYRPNLYTLVANDGGFEKNAWQFREAFRIRQKIYAAISFSPKTQSEQQLLQLLNAKKEHFVHLSKDAPGYIAYTPDEASGVQDRRVKTTVGRYLKKHFELDDPKIREMTDAFRNRYGIEDVKFARTDEEVTRVYTKGPTSCMSNAFDNTTDSKARYGSHVHPSVVYASPNVAVAYLERNGKINSRCVVYDNPENPADKRYIRVYGDDVLRLKLESMGYSLGNMDGVALRKIVGRRTDNVMLPDTYVMPYIDDMTRNEVCFGIIEKDRIVLVGSDKASRSGKQYFGCRHQCGLVGRHAEYRRSHGSRYDVGPNPKILDSSDSGVELSVKTSGKYTCVQCKTKENVLTSRSTGEHICEKCIESGTQYRRVMIGVDDYDVVHVTAPTITVDGIEGLILNTDATRAALKITQLNTVIYGPDKYALRDKIVVTNNAKTILMADAVSDVTGRIYHIDDVYAVGKKYVGKDRRPWRVAGLGVNTATQQLEIRMVLNSDELHWKTITQLFDELSINIKPRMRKKALTAHLLNGDMNAIEVLYKYYKEYVAEHHPDLVNKVAQGVLIEEETEVSHG